MLPYRIADTPKKEGDHVEGVRIYFKAPDPKTPSLETLDLKKDEASRANFQWVAYQLLFSVTEGEETQYYIFNYNLTPEGKAEMPAKVFESDSAWSGKNKDTRTSDFTAAEVIGKFPDLLKGPELDPGALDRKKAQAVYINIGSSGGMAEKKAKIAKTYSTQDFKRLFDNNFYVVLNPKSKKLENPLGKAIGEKSTESEKAAMEKNELYAQAIKTAIDRSKPYAGGFNIMENLVEDLRKEQKKKKKESLLAPIIQE